MASTLAGIHSLPPETLALIARYARDSDIKVREDKRRPSDGKHTRSGRGHAKRKSESWKADSVLCLARTSRAMSDIALPALWRSVDLTEVSTEAHEAIADLLERTHGKHVRQLQLKVAFGTTSQGQSNDPCAMSIPTAARILANVPLLSWLEVEFLAPSAASYVSILPQLLATALQSHTQLKHFGISCDSAPESPFHFELDEGLVAGLVSTFTRLESLTLHRIGYDVLLRHSPLFEAVSALERLTKLNVLEVQSVNDLWTTAPLGKQLKELTLVCCHRLSPSAMDKLLEQHKLSLESLSLVKTPHKDHPAFPPQNEKQKYDLPALRRLYIEADDTHIDSIAYLERFSKTNLESLTVKYAAGISVLEMEGFIMNKTIKSLKRAEIGLAGLAAADEQRLEDLAFKAQNVGVEVVISDRSTLARL